MRNLLYRLYERSLENSLTLEDLPRHIGVILDGNRRWAERKPGTTTADGRGTDEDAVLPLRAACREARAAVAGPASPEKPFTPVPATVRMYLHWRCQLASGSNWLMGVL